VGIKLQKCYSMLTKNHVNMHTRVQKWIQNFQLIGKVPEGLEVHKKGVQVRYYSFLVDNKPLKIKCMNIYFQQVLAGEQNCA
jgi:hypothetical protein